MPKDIANAVSAQIPAEITSQYKKKHPNSDLVTLKDEESVEITVSSDGLINLTTKYGKEILFLNDKANYYNENTIFFDDFRTISSVNAYSSIPTEKKYKKLKVKNFEERDVMSSGIFYSDSKELL